MNTIELKSNNGYEKLQEFELFDSINWFENPNPFIQSTIPGVSYEEILKNIAFGGKYIIKQIILTTKQIPVSDLTITIKQKDIFGKVAQNRIVARVEEMYPGEPDRYFVRYSIECDYLLEKFTSIVISELPFQSSIRIYCADDIIRTSQSPKIWPITSEPTIRETFDLYGWKQKIGKKRFSGSPADLNFRKAKYFMAIDDGAIMSPGSLFHIYYTPYKFPNITEDKIFEGRIRTVEQFKTVMEVLGINPIKKNEIKPKTF